MTSTEFANCIFAYHNTWADVASTAICSAFIIGLVYVWRTTRKK